MFQSLPKIELHLHLDCSVSFRSASALNPQLTREEFDREFKAPAKCTNLVDVLTRAARGFELMQTKAALRLVTLDMFEQLAADNVIYAEVRFAPHLHLEQGLTPEEVVATVDEAAQEGSRQSGIEARLILCSLRHYSPQQAMETVLLVEKFRGSAVVALDLAGDEAGFPLDANVPAFAYAIEHGIARTAHAGEACGPESVWETLRLLQPARIGHGVRSAEDPELVEHLKRAGLHLEVCPSSNIQTNIFDGHEDHCIDALFRAGVSVGVNTDSRTMGNVTLTEEYERMHRTFAWTVDQFLRCNQNALAAAFVPDDVRARLQQRLELAYSGAADAVAPAG